MKKSILLLAGCFLMFSCADPDSREVDEPVTPVIPAQKTKSELWDEWSASYEALAHDETLNLEEGLELLQKSLDKALTDFLSEEDIKPGTSCRQFIDQNTKYFVTDIPRQLRFWVDWYYPNAHKTFQSIEPVYAIADCYDTLAEDPATFERIPATRVAYNFKVQYWGVFYDCSYISHRKMHS